MLPWLLLLLIWWYISGLNDIPESIIGFETTLETHTIEQSNLRLNDKKKKKNIKYTKNDGNRIENYYNRRPDNLISLSLKRRKNNYSRKWKYLKTKTYYYVDFLLLQPVQHTQQWHSSNVIFPPFRPLPLQVPLSTPHSNKPLPQTPLTEEDKPACHF